MTPKLLTVLTLAGLAPVGRDFGPTHTDGSRPVARLEADAAARLDAARAKRDRKNARRLALIGR